MIVAIVRAKLPEGMTRELHAERSRKSADRFLNMPGLIRKNYLVSFEQGVGGGAYTWESREAAEACHKKGSPWWENFVKSFGTEPEVTFYESPVLVDNVVGDIFTPGTVLTRQKANA